MLKYLESPIAQKIFDSYTKSASDWRRPHLGCSLIGHPCARHLWFSFRWSVAPDFPGRMLRLFDTGSREEPRLIRDLRNAGITALDVDPDTGKQFRAEFTNHISGSMDGIGVGFDEAPNKWHVLEFKTHSEKSFSELTAKGVEKAKPQHFAQMLLYMLYMSEKHEGNFDRAMYLAVNKNNDDIYPERVKLDKKKARSLLEKAQMIIDSPTPPPGIAQNEKAPDCVLCLYKGLCYGGETKREVNCRTCLHSTPAPEAWTCAVQGPIGDQKKACSRHLFIPDFFPGRSVISARNDKIIYDKGINYAGGRCEEL
jgi:CRISPR/Cas system-associated exonuclease Cas4 (RecB family)